MQRGLRVITLQGSIKKSPILLSQYWKNEWLDGTIIISYFDGSNNIFADYNMLSSPFNGLENRKTLSNFILHQTWAIFLEQNSTSIIQSSINKD